MGAAQNPTEQLKGIDSRGTAALRQAIATGSPVPTNGKQAKELAGEWTVHGCTLVRGGKAKAVSFSPQVVNDIANKLNTANTLAAENARLRAALTKIAYDPFGNPEATHADLLQTITEFAIATLEGGAK